MQITSAQLAEILQISSSLAGSWVSPLNAAMDKYSINDVNRISAFIAQVGHESARLSVTVENLNYSTAGLLGTFPKYFDSTSAPLYANKPEMIANRVYANRFGNGPEESGDGWNNRGRGLIQLTFKDNYIAASRGIGVNFLADGSLLEGKDYAALSAGWFWNSKGLNAYADRGDFDTTTKRISGGFTGKADRDFLYQRALKVLGGKDPEKTPDLTPVPSTTSEIYAVQTKIANKTSISESVWTGGKAGYPNNKVNESLSGHITELDDTPGNERIHIYHRAGSYHLMDPVGAMTHKSVLDFFEIAAQDKYQKTGGDETIVVDGQSFKKVGTDCVIDVGGSMYIKASEIINLAAPFVTFSNTLTGPSAEFGDVKIQSLKTGDVIDGTCALALDIGDNSGGFRFSSLQAALTLGPTSFKPTQQIQTDHSMVIQGSEVFLFPNGTGRIPCYKDSDGDWRRFSDDSVYIPPP